MKARAKQNRTLICSEKEIEEYSTHLLCLNSKVGIDKIENKIIQQDFFQVASFIPNKFVDLLILDPPYNLSKNYNGHLFRERDKSEYQKWFSSLIGLIKPLLKTTATIYVCSDWKTSLLITPILEDYFHIRNRITWEREKGRGAKTNWKNNTEDIWFCTNSEEYIFNIDAVKLKRKVLAPYRTKDGIPKDWEEEQKGNFRLTHPSNIWTDITIPFWSMPENTDHPTQKPEKLIAKLILASSNKGDMVFDPCAGSGTTAVVAKKLGRRFVCVDINKEYCCWSLKRLKLAEKDFSIQGYADNVFWERNSLADQFKTKRINSLQEDFLS